MFIEMLHLVMLFSQLHGHTTESLEMGGLIQVRNDFLLEL
jgi:hypothetical protein